MAGFEYRQAAETREALARHGVRYLFIGKSGAILLGFPDPTQDADLFVDKTPENGRALASALADLGFALTNEQRSDLEKLTPKGLERMFRSCRQYAQKGCAKTRSF